MPLAPFAVKPVSLNYSTIDYPSVSSLRFEVTNGPDLSGIVVSASVNSSFFVFNVSEYNTLTSTVLAPSSVLSATLSSNWADTYFDGPISATLTVNVSAQNASLSAFTIPVTGTFNGLEYPENVIDVAGFAYDSPEEHARLYVNGNI